MVTPSTLPRLTGRPLFSFEGRAPQVHPEAWVAPTATLIGDVVVEAGASVSYGVVLRSGFGSIVMCVVHGAVVGAQALIGNGATVQDGARVGRRSLIGAHSRVPPGAEIPDEVLAMGSPARVRGPLSQGAAGWVEGTPSIYQELARRHAAGIVEVGVPPASTARSDDGTVRTAPLRASVDAAGEDQSHA